MNATLLMNALPDMWRWPPLASEPGPSISLFRHFVIEGGWITWFVLIPLSMVMLSLVIHYLIVIRHGTLAPAGLARSLEVATKQGQAGTILQALSENETMLGQAVHAGLSQLPAGREAARAAIDETVEELAMRLLRKIEYLNVIGNVSPMIGLFGTVVGMIQAFARIYSAAGGMPEADKLAGDIAIALVTTFWGLLIAIPALASFALFRNRIETYAAEVVKMCDGLLATSGLTPESRSFTGESRSPSGRG